VTLTLFGNHFADNAMGACQFKSVREVIAYPDDSGELPEVGMAAGSRPTASSASGPPGRVRVAAMQTAHQAEAAAP
jgi:hypothetical protein